MWVLTDAQFDDSTAVSPQRTYTEAGQVTVRLLVTDNPGASSTPFEEALTPAGGSLQVPASHCCTKEGSFSTIPDLNRSS